MQVKPSLLSKLYSIHAFFFAQWNQVPLYQLHNNLTQPPIDDVSFEDIDLFANFMDKTDDEGSGSSSGGTKTGSSHSKTTKKTTHINTHSVNSGNTRLKDLAKDTDDSGDSGDGNGGGGGTMKGLRVEKQKNNPLSTKLKR